ncbi:MAG: recombinase family protein [Myxococcales bacterium]|nr:recombinase family protein [Myxococcales bacterium]
MKAAAYIRVSSRAQTYKTQRDAIERVAEAQNVKIDHWYREKQSGKTVARPELARIRADARAGKIGRLFIHRLDRLTRSGIRDTIEVVEELRDHGCEIVTVADGFDMDGPAAEIILALMAWSAKMERLVINERISAARDRVEAEGGKWGRSRRMSLEAVCRAQAMRAKGETVRAIAEKFGVPLATMSRALAER